MAIEEVQLVRPLDGTEDEAGRWTYSLLYRVITDDINDGPGTARRASGVPQRGDTYLFGNEGDTWAFCVGGSARLEKEEESRRTWAVTVNYKYPQGREDEKRDPTDSPADPLDEPPIIYTSSQKGKKSVLYDKRDRLIASSAGEPYDPVQEADDTKYMLHISRNQATVDLPLYSIFRDAINSEQFFGCARGTVKVETPGAIRKLYKPDGTPYYNVTWEFAIDDEGWDRELFDYGMYKVVGGVMVDGKLQGGKLQVLKDLSGADLTSPRLLDGEGGVLAIGATPVKLPKYELYNYRPFSMLELPESL